VESDIAIARSVGASQREGRRTRRGMPKVKRMKTSRRGFRPAYNQFATNTKSTAIAGVSVDNIGSDMGKMLPMNDALAGQYGTRPRQHLADGGFAKLDDIEALAQNGVEIFMPVPKPRNA